MCVMFYVSFYNLMHAEILPNSNMGAEDRNTIILLKHSFVLTHSQTYKLAYI